MEIVLEKKDTTSGVLKVNLKQSDYKFIVDGKLKEFSKKATLKGFRPGKIPAGLVHKMYGKSILMDEVSKMVGTAINHHIKDNNLNIIGEPLPVDEVNGQANWDNAADFDFAYEIGIVPDFKYDLSGNYTAYKIKVDNSSVSETVENLRSQFGRMITPEASVEGDFVSGNVKPVGSDTEVATMIPTNRLTKTELKKFTGLKIGDKVVFDPKKAFDNDTANIGHALGITKEEAANVSGEYELVVDKITRSGLAEIDQDFFDRVFGKDVVKSETEFMDKLKATVADNYDRETKNLLIRDVREDLIAKSDIALPKDFLKKWLISTNDGKLTLEQIEQEFDLYVKELKWTLIKNKFAQEKEVKVEHVDVLGKAKEMIKSQFGFMPLNDELEASITQWAENYLKENKGKNYMDIYEQVLSEKTFSKLVESVKTSEKSVTVDEFKKHVEALA